MNLITLMLQREIAMYEFLDSKKLSFFFIALLLVFVGTALAGDISELKIMNIGLGDSLKTARGELDNTKLLKSGLDSVPGHKLIFSQITNESFLSLGSHDEKIYEIRFLVKRKSDAEQDLLRMLRKADDDVFDYYNSNKNSDIEKGYVKKKVFDFSRYNRLASVEIFDSYSIFTFTDPRKASDVVRQVFKPQSRFDGVAPAPAAPIVPATAPGK